MPRLSAAQERKELSKQLQAMFNVMAPEGVYPTVVTSCQVFKLGPETKEYSLKGQRKTLALARVVLNESIQLTGLRVVNGVHGLFVMYPNDPAYTGEDYRSLFYPVTKALRELIEQTVLAKYKEQP